jgi:hypothetical protein
MVKSRSKHIEKYLEFLKYSHPDDIPCEEIATKYDCSVKTIYALLGVDRRNPKIAELLMDKFDIKRKQFPSWFVLPPKEVNSATKAELKPEHNPRQDELSSASSNDINDHETLERISNTSEQSNKKRTVQGINLAQLNQPDSSQAKAQPNIAGVSNEENSTDNDDFIEKIVNNVLVRELSLQAVGIVRKVALNPTTLLSYEYLKGATEPDTGMPYFVGDLADFLNYCVKFTMKQGLGIEPAIVKSRYGLLDQMRDAQHQSTDRIGKLW